MECFPRASLPAGRLGIVLAVLAAASCSRKPSAPEFLPVKLYPVQIAGQFGFVDEQGAAVIEPRFESARLFSEDLAAVRFAGKWGYIGLDGKEKIDPRFEEAGDFHEGLAAIRENGRWGFIDSSGRMVIPPQFEEAGHFKGGAANVRIGTKWQFISPRGAQMFKGRQFDYAKPFSEGLAAVNMGGALDVDGVFAGGSWGFIDATGKEVIGFRFGNARGFHQGMAAVRDASSWAFIDRTGTVVIPMGLSVPGDFWEGRALAMREEGWGYIDLKGAWAIPSDYPGATRFHAGRALVARAGSQWGLIDLAGNPVGPDTFEAPGIFD